MLILSKTDQVAATVTSDVINRPSKGGRFRFDITAENGSATFDAKVQVLDQTSGVWTDLPGAAITQQTGIGHTMLTVYPSLTTVTATVAVAQYLGGPFRVSVTVGSTGNMTFTVDYTPLP